jgi:hypothetical protein
MIKLPYGSSGHRINKRKERRSDYEKRCLQEMLEVWTSLVGIYIVLKPDVRGYLLGVLFRDFFLIELGHRAGRGSYCLDDGLKRTTVDEINRGMAA